jgi:hypothetical protein
VTILPDSIDYTDRDFDSLRARLISLVQRVFPDWTDFDVASFGNLLLEMFAFVGDVLTFYQDASARESRLVNATQRNNVIALAKMLGYRLHGARAATAEVRFQLARSSLAAVTFPAGTVVRTQEVTEPVRFQLLAPVTIAAGAAPPVAVGVVEHSRTHTQDYRCVAAASIPTLRSYVLCALARGSAFGPRATHSLRSCIDAGFLRHLADLRFDTHEALAQPRRYHLAALARERSLASLLQFALIENFRDLAPGHVSIDAQDQQHLIVGRKLAANLSKDVVLRLEPRQCRVAQGHGQLG